MARGLTPSEAIAQQERWEAEKLEREAMRTCTDTELGIVLKDYFRGRRIIREGYEKLEESTLGEIFRNYAIVKEFGATSEHEIRIT